MKKFILIIAMLFALQSYSFERERVEPDLVYSLDEASQATIEATIDSLMEVVSERDSSENYLLERSDSICILSDLTDSVIFLKGNTQKPDIGICDAVLKRIACINESNRQYNLKTHYTYLKNLDTSNYGSINRFVLKNNKKPQFNGNGERESLS